MEQCEKIEEMYRIMKELWVPEFPLTKLLKANNDVQSVTTLSLANFTKHNTE